MTFKNLNITIKNKKDEKTVHITAIIVNYKRNHNKNAETFSCEMFLAQSFIFSPISYMSLIFDKKF
jgi:hypothetical protein